MTKKPDGRIPIRCTGTEICHFSIDDILLCGSVWTVSVRPSVSKILSRVVRFGEDFPDSILAADFHVVLSGRLFQREPDRFHAPEFSGISYGTGEAEHKNRSEWLPVLEAVRISSSLLIAYTRSQSGCMWHSLNPI